VGQQVLDAIAAYLDKYGIDVRGDHITKHAGVKKQVYCTYDPSNIKNLEPGASKRKFEKGDRKL